MTDWVYLSIDQVHDIHAAVIREHGGSLGVRDEGLIESAVAAPQASFGGEPIFKDAVEIAGAYLFYICSNHAFVDGNKRTALVASLTFLRMNGIEPQPDSEAWEKLVLDVASGHLDREATVLALRNLVP